jgi:hypothetical protein
VPTTTFIGSVKEEARKSYIAVFEQDWPSWLAGMLIAFVALLIFLWQSPWGIVGGYKNWGDWVFYALGVEKTRPNLPWLHTMSVSNVGLFSGALASAFLSRQFKLRPSPPMEYVKGIVGGIFMGTGAALAGGCNVGGFYTAIGMYSMGGYAMMIGLGAGAWLGLRYLLWEMAKFPPKMTADQSPATKKAPRINWNRVQPYFGGTVLLAVVCIFYLYSFLDKTQVGGFLFFGLLIGFIMHRSRFCFVRAFRCPFMTGDAEMVRVVALSLAIYGMGAAVIKWNFLQPDTMGVYHPFWMGSLSGGILFGFGMLLAGGCGSSTLWRIGEGHIKLMIVLATFALTNSRVNAFLATSGLEEKLGKGILVPAVLSWPLTLPLFLGILLLWVFWAVWNEKTEKCVIF